MSQFTGIDLDCFRAERTVFQGLGFALGPGGALMLRGPNGTGKSSLLRLMAGLARPVAGAIQWNGDAIADDPEAHNARLHYVGHADPIKAVLSVAENLAFWAGMRPRGDDGPGRWPGAVSAAARVEAALDRFGIGHLAPLPARFLSAGQRRRVNLARLLAAPAPLWLLDEPHTALDAEAVRRLEDVIAAHRAAGGMVVMSSHASAAPAGADTLDLSVFQARPREARP